MESSGDAVLMGSGRHGHAFLAKHVTLASRVLFIVSGVSYLKVLISTVKGVEKMKDKRWAKISAFVGF